MVGCWLDGCLLLVRPAIRAPNGAWANNREYLGDSIAHRRAVHFAESLMLQPGRECCTRFSSRISSRAHIQGFVLISASFRLRNNVLPGMIQDAT